MKIEQANEISKKAIEQLAQALAQGESETIKAYLFKIAQFRDYSFKNTMMIIAQNPNASRVAGFRAWKKLGRFVRKGEKGIVIIAPIVRYAKPEEARNKDLKAVNDEQRVEKAIGYKATYVFDISQTEGEDLPEMSTVSGDPQHYLEKLKTFIAQLGIEVKYEEQGGDLFGFSSGGKITINPLLNTNQAVEFSTLAHELAHELMHQQGEKKTKVVRETEAEAVAAVVCQAIGLQAVQASTDYIQLYQGNLKIFQASLEGIQTTVNKILAGVLEE